MTKEADAEQFRRQTMPVREAVSENRYEDAMRIAIEGLREAKKSRKQVLVESYLSLIRSLVVILEDEFGEEQ